MPALEDAQLELFAQALARGVRAHQASVEAGYDDDPGKPYARAGQPEVDARVREIRLAREGGANPDLAPLIDELMGIAWDCRKQGTPALMGAAIRALAAAGSLKRLLPPPPKILTPIEPPRRMSRKEWLAKYGGSEATPLAKPDTER